MKKRTVACLNPPGGAVIGPVKYDRDGYMRCRVCGCTEREPCAESCGWVGNIRVITDLCTSCAQAVEALRDWRENAHRPSIAALLREVGFPHKAKKAKIVIARESQIKRGVKRAF